MKLASVRAIQKFILNTPYFTFQSLNLCGFTNGYCYYAMHARVLLSYKRRSRRDAS